METVQTWRLFVLFLPPPLNLALSAVCSTAALLQKDVGCEEEREGGSEFHIPDTPNVKTKCKGRSGKGSGRLVLIRSGVVSVIAHRYTPLTPSTL